MSRPRTLLPLVLLGLLGAFVALSPEPEAPPLPAGHSVIDESHVPIPAPRVRVTRGLATEPVAAKSERQDSTHAERLTAAIYAGAALRFTTDGSELPAPRFQFRPTTATADSFRASLGTGEETLKIDSMQVFTGRTLLGSQRASLAIVNGAIAAHLRLADGSIRHFRSNPETGEVETILEQPQDRICAIDPDTGVATTRSLSLEPLAEDPWSDARPASIEPEIAASSGENPANGNLQFVDRPIPYGRLYDQSLKDILVLVVLDKGATGGDSSGNLSSKTANYLSIMSNISAMYEHNLGLRTIVQEIILTPNTGDYSDVAGGSGSLSDFRSWVSSNRSRGNYDWTVAAKFGNVSGNGTLGVAYVSAASGSNGVSINKTGNLTVPAHEIGHNMGSGHSDGGVMNATANSSRNFFRDLNNQSRTSAWAIYNYMSNGGASTQGRAFPSNRKLRHAEQIPFADDDNVTTFPNQPVRFRPMANDDTSVLRGAENELSLVEAGAIFPPGAGEVWVYGDEIEFRPAPGFTRTAWLSYTIRGSVGNSGQGWLHKGDVAIRIDGSGTGPPAISSTTATADFIHHSGTGALVINPLVDDHGPGHLNVSQVTPTLGTSGTSASLNNGFLIANASLLDPDKGTLASNRVDITLSGGSRVNLTRHLTFTPDPGASGPARIQYTVADGNGSETTQTATVLFGIDDVLLAEGAAARFRVPADASDSSTWALEAFDDSTWSEGNTGVGYETSSSGTLYTNLIETDTRSAMFNSRTSIYIRVPFEVVNPDDIQSLRLEMQYDDGFVASINGSQVQSRNAPDPITWDGVATDNHEANVNSYSSYDISSSIGQLHPGINLLAIQGFNVGSDSSDFIIRPRLIATTRFTLAGINLPRDLSIPSGVGLVLDGFLRGIDEPPFANAATVQWYSIEGQVIFDDPSSAATTARFAKPGNHTLRMRVSEAGYVEEHELRVAVGIATPQTSPSAIAGPDLILGADDSIRLSGLTDRADSMSWRQIDGPTAWIGTEGSVRFTADGTHTFRLSATKGLITTFDDVQIVSGSGVLDIAPEGSLARHLVPTSADDLVDAADNAWTQIDFDDADWELGAALYGFERGDGGYQSLFSTDLQQAMFDTNASMLMRLRFFSPLATPVTLRLRYEDGFSAHLNGDRVAASNVDGAPLPWDGAANSSQGDSAAVQAEAFALGSAASGENTLAIHGLNSSTTSSDFLLLPELTQAVSSGDPFRAQLITPDSPAKTITPAGAISQWAQSGFDDSNWNQAAAAVGYERSGGGNFDEHFFTDLESFVYDTNETTYLRIPFLLPDGFTVHSLTLRAKYDDGFVAHLNGAEIVRRNFSGVPSWNSSAATARVEADTTRFETIDLGEAIGNLATGENTLAVQVLNSGLTSSDLLFVPELVAELEPISGSAYTRWFDAIPGSGGLDDSPQLDLDFDRLSNLLEFAFGGSPLNAEPSVIAPTIHGEQFTFRRRINHVADGLTYVIESSRSLRESSWNPLAGLAETIAPSGDPEIEIVTVQLPNPSLRRFFRLRVSLEDQ